MFASFFSTQKIKEAKLTKNEEKKKKRKRKNENENEKKKKMQEVEEGGVEGIILLYYSRAAKRTKSHPRANPSSLPSPFRGGSKSIKDYFRSFFCQLICLQLIFFLAQFRFLPMKRNTGELSQSYKKK